MKKTYDKHSGKVLSVIIPSYNEGGTICLILNKILAVELPYSMTVQIVVVDDGSSDDTEGVIRRFVESHSLSASQLMYCKLDRNRGKGYAVRKGIEMATGNYIIIQDADLEYDPADWPSLLQPLLDGECKVVYGSRVLGKNVYKYKSFYYGGRFISWVTTFLFGTHITDEATCYKLFDAKLLKSIPLKVNRFGFCPEVTSKILSRGYQIKELPIRYYPRTKDEGKKIKWKDGVDAILILLKYRLFEENSIDNPKKKTSAYAFSFLRGLGVLAVIVAIICYFMTKDYSDGYRQITQMMSDNMKCIKEYKNESYDNRLYMKLGKDYEFIRFIRNSTPSNAVLLWPSSEQFHIGEKFQQAISNRVWVTRFLYPRRVVMAEEIERSPWARKVTHIVIVNGEIAGNIPFPEGQEIPEFAVLPAECN